MSDIPKRRLQLKLDLEADDLRELSTALTNLAYWLEADGREERETTSGGYGSGYHLTLTCNPDMDHEHYVALSSQWMSSRRTERAS